MVVEFDDHEIWGAPVAVPGPVDPEPEAAPTVAPVTAGRLYRSVGSDEHPDAVVALPDRKAMHQTLHTSASAPLEPQAPITINSRIPRAVTVEDSAIADLIAPPAPTAPVEVATAEPQPEHSGFTSWFRAPKQPTPAVPEDPSQPVLPVATPAATAAAVASGAAQKVFGTIGDLATTVNRIDGMNTRGFVAIATAVTFVVALLDALLTQSLGLPTGIALIAVTAFGAWKLDAASRWAGWVMPSYVLIAVILLTGHFVAGAPGFSIIGNAMLIVTSLIVLAPWLAIASALGAVLPIFKRRKA